MSITSLIKKDEEVKSQFAQFIHVPKIELHYPLKAESLTEKPNLIGQAFDYLMRFYLESRHPQNIIYKFPWIAFKSYQMMVNNYLHVFQQDFRDEVELTKKRHLLNYLNLELIHAQHAYNQFLKTDLVTDELLDCCLFLARLDELYRIRKINKDLKARITPMEIEDLRNLYHVLESLPLRATEHLILNPSFGEASILAKGADADFIFDHTIVDIKVHSKMDSSKELIYQLVAYAMCIEIGGIAKTYTRVKINNLATYYARHGVLLSYPLDEIIAPEDFSNLTSWFYNHLKNGHQ